uniref:VWFA domain-containing protein n=1 Tax=Heterorhabditis bacteriophora TaxID=37862 RepID=A0A1I7X512_HETBA
MTEISFVVVICENNQKKMFTTSPVKPSTLLSNNIRESNSTLHITNTTNKTLPTNITQTTFPTSPTTSTVRTTSAITLTNAKLNVNAEDKKSPQKGKKKIRRIIRKKLKAPSTSTTKVTPSIRHRSKIIRKVKKIRKNSTTSPTTTQGIRQITPLLLESNEKNMTSLNLRITPEPKITIQVEIIPNLYYIYIFKSTTYIGAALELAKNQLETRRRDNDTLVVLISDGFSQDDASRPAEKIRGMENVEFYAVSLSNLSNMNYLRHLTQNPEKVFVGAEVHLLQNNLKARLQCNG